MRAPLPKPLNCPQAVSLKSNPSLPLLSLMIETKRFGVLVKWIFFFWSRKEKKENFNFSRNYFPWFFVLAANLEKQNKRKPKHTNNYSNSGCASLGCPRRCFPKASLAEPGDTHTSCTHCYSNGEGKAHPSQAPPGVGEQGSTSHSWTRIGYKGSTPSPRDLGVQVSKHLRPPSLRNMHNIHSYYL